MATRYTAVTSETPTRLLGSGPCAQPAHGEEGGVSFAEGTASWCPV